MSGWTAEVDSIRKAILAGKPLLLAEAEQLRREVEGILQGTQLTVPGLGGSWGSLAAGNGPVAAAPVSNDYSINLHIANANLGNRQNVEGLMAEMGGIRRSRMAGLGTVE